ncbi:MAG: KH type 2 domain protein [Candidatus Parvarchaeum acidophilus ARMAN-5]|uniref:KH type 2 domain protein n=1 Tax=Candidatus Parvarchaeum acidophilus ARMAN-5 TaxID=662762 RepID=D6GW07_PARA5|nr:MAG: KH type 2 domain protein [Candidatus Parvarchaeum acidophilus ARMAN-5]
MLSKKIITDKVNEESAREYLFKKFNRFGISDIKIEKTPLGMKIIIKTPKPGAIITRANQILRESSKDLGEFFKQESPRIEVENSLDPNLDPAIIADSIAFKIAKFGPMKYKVVIHKAMDSIMAAGAKGVEIEIGGVIKERAAHFKFRPIGSVMPKTGQVEFFGVRTAKKQLVLKRGSIGIKVTIVVPTETVGGIKINGGRESEGSGDGAPENEHKEDARASTS